MTTSPPPSAVRVTTKTARHRLIVDLLEHHEVESQAALAHHLRERGFDVTQATLSRDLDELRAVKITASSGGLVYAIPRDGGDPSATVISAVAAISKLQRVVGELVSSVDHSGNIVVLRTPPGAAQYLASTIDHSTAPDIIGTIAGDDTVLMVTRDPKGGVVV
ncbi:MAG: arginine repressor, partial [Actinobacteria bacterium]|nr:arginine repressor [Actinomycetota bacterium]